MHRPVVQAKLRQIEEWKQRVTDKEAKNKRLADEKETKKEKFLQLISTKISDKFDATCIEMEMDFVDLPEEKLDELINTMEKDREQFLNCAAISVAYGKICQFWLDRLENSQKVISPLEIELREKVQKTLSYTKSSKDKIDILWLKTLLDKVSSGFPKYKNYFDPSSEEYLFKSITREVSAGDVKIACRRALKKPNIDKNEEGKISNIMNDDDVAKEYASLFTSWIQNIQNWNWYKEELTTRFSVSANRNRCKWLLILSAMDIIFLEIVGGRLNSSFKVILREILNYSSCGSDPRKQFYNVYTDKNGNFSPQIFAPYFEDESTNWFDAYGAGFEVELGVACLPSCKGDQRGGYESSSALSDGEVVEGHWPFFCLNGLLRLSKIAAQENEQNFTSSLGVVSLDVDSCGLSTSHEVVEVMAKFLGFDEHWITFLHKILQPKVYFKNGEVVELQALQKGVVMEDSLSVFLRELPLYAADLALAYYRSTKEIDTGRPYCFRYHDDVFLVSPDIESLGSGYNEYLQFWEKLGLTPNSSKAGFTFCLPDPSVDVVEATKRHNLPRNNCLWGSLELHSDGTWSPNQAKIDEWRAILQEELLNEPDILFKVRIYNSFVGHIITKTWSGTGTLDSSIDDSLIKMLFTLHYGTFGPGKGIVDHLRETACKLHGFDPEMFPEGWFYWPMSAGGLSLENPVVQHLPVRAARMKYDREVLELFKEAFKEYKNKKTELGKEESEIEKKDQKAEVKQGLIFQLDQQRKYLYIPVQNAFNDMIRHVTKPEAPGSTQQFSQWKDAFETRLREVFSQEQELRNYWAWIIAKYGGDIERIFGTFNFLKTEHVSSVLITMIRKSGST